MEYDLAFLYVFIFATSNHSDEVSSKSERVTWGPLVDLTRNDPCVNVISIFHEKGSLNLSIEFVY